MVAVIQVGLGSVTKRKSHRNLTELPFIPGIPRRELEHYRDRRERERERDINSTSPAKVPFLFDQLLLPVLLYKSYMMNTNLQEEKSTIL